MNGVHDDDEHEAMKDLVAVLALGALGESDHRVATLHLASCPECRDEFAALRPVADAVGMTAEQDVPAQRRDALRARVMASITPSRPAGVARAHAWLVWLPSLAAAALLIFSVITVQRNVALRAQVAHERAIVADVTAPDARRYAVTGGEVIRRGSRLYLALRSLPPLPAGKVYEAWTEAKGAKTMAPSVTFAAPERGPEIIALPIDASGIAAVAVSVEPAGGSRAPTTTPTFVRPLTGHTPQPEGRGFSERAAHATRRVSCFADPSNNESPQAIRTCPALRRMLMAAFVSACAA